MKAENLDSTFLVSSCDSPEVEWLSSSLTGLGKVIPVGDTVEELSRLVEVMGASVVFIGIDHRHQVQQCTLIEGLIEARPMTSVVAVGDGADSDLVIAAMRAGARDFIPYGLRASEVTGLVRRVMTKMPALPVRGEQADITLLYSAQPDPDAALVATHLALAAAESGRDTLLVDLGLPAGESVAILGVDGNFYFDDALRNLRRIDSSVIDSAFVQCEDGLWVLPLLDDSFGLENCQSAELFLLFGALRQHFGHIVVNLCGQRDSELVRALAAGADQLLWYVDQSVPCSRRNLGLLQRWRSDGIKLDRCQLVVDRYQSRQAPDDATLARTYDLPLAATLPLSAELRLASRNQGEPATRLMRRDALSKALLQLARQVGTSASAGAGPLGWLTLGRQKGRMK